MLQFGLQLTTYLVRRYFNCHVGVQLRLINGDLGLKLENVQVDMLGFAKVTISKDDTIVGVTRKALRGDVNKYIILYQFS